MDHGGPEIIRSAPVLGEHSEEILHEIGYSAAEVQGLVASGATRLWSPAPPAADAQGKAAAIA